MPSRLRRLCRREISPYPQFYVDLSFTIVWSDSDLAYLRCGQCSFLLQNFYHPEHAGNFMMHLLVGDVEASPSRFRLSRLLSPVADMVAVEAEAMAVVV